MNETLLARRSEMLNLFSLGINLQDIVGQLASKYGRHPTTLYQDFRKMPKWGPIVSAMEDTESVTWVILHALRRHVARAWQTYTLAGQNMNARLSALREMRGAYMDLFRVLIVTGKIKQVPVQYEDVTELADLIEWDALSNEERTFITEGARVVIKSSRKKQSEGIH